MIRAYSSFIPPIRNQGRPRFGKRTGLESTGDQRRVYWFSVSWTCNRLNVLLVTRGLASSQSTVWPLYGQLRGGRLTGKGLFGAQSSASVAAGRQRWLPANRRAHREPTASLDAGTTELSFAGLRSLRDGPLLHSRNRDSRARRHGSRGTMMS